MDRTSQAFALFKAPHIAEAIARNARLMTLDKCATHMRAVDTVMVIGAGHTLPDDVHATLLHKREVVTIAVNSALMPLASRGFWPDMLLCRESISMAEQIRRASEVWRQMPRSEWPIAVLDVGTHHDTWLACLEVCADVRWFVPASTQTFGLAAHTGIEPLYGGTSNVTAAVALAERWGAERIELLGCTRAFGPDGQAYASGSDWSTVKLERVEAATLPDGTVDHYLGHVSGLEAKDALHLASGQRPPLRVERMVPVVAIDGSRRWAPETLEGDREWLANFAARRPELDLWQHEPDVAIDGWGHAPRRSLQAEPFDAVAELRTQTERTLAMVKAMGDGTPAVDVPGLLEGSAIVDYAAAGDTLTVLRTMRNKGPAVTVPAVCRAWESAAHRVAEWIR